MLEAGRAKLQPRRQPKGLFFGTDFFVAENSDATFAAEYNLSPIGLVTLDRNGCICRLNLAAASLLKGNRSQLIDMPFLAFVERSYCRTFLDHLASCIRFRRNISSEVVLAGHTRSSLHPVELQSVPGVDQYKGGVICRTAILTKLQRELAANALSADQQSYAELFELSPDAVLIHVGGKIVCANPGAVKLLGAKGAGDLVGRDIFAVIHPDYHSMVRERIQQLRQGEHELPVIEEKFLRLDGKCVSVSVMSRSAIFRGSPATLVLARDLSAHQAMEEDLHRAKDLSEQILANNSIATAIISWDSQRFVNANEIFCTVTGFSRSVLVGRPLSEIGWNLTGGDQSDLIEKLGSHRSIQSCEARIRRPDGGYVNVLVSAKPILCAGEESVLLIIQDLTDLQRLKQDVVAISEEEQRRFSRDLHDSHCQDLTAIAFFAETIADKLDGQDPESAGQIRSLGQMVSRSAENVRSLAVGLGSQKVEESGLGDALEELATRTSERFGLVCTAKVGRKHRIRDTGLAVHLYRIAQEATSNAARHSHARTIDIKLYLEGDAGTLRIEDDGTGFSLEKKTNGLGLRTMEYRAAVIKGTLHIDSRPGIGTVVTCSFPTSAAQ